MTRIVWIDFNVFLALSQPGVRWLTDDADRMQRRSKLAEGDLSRKRVDCA